MIYNEKPHSVCVQKRTGRALREKIRHNERDADNSNSGHNRIAQCGLGGKSINRINNTKTWMDLLLAVVRPWLRAEVWVIGAAEKIGKLTEDLHHVCPL